MSAPRKMWGERAEVAHTNTLANAGAKPADKADRRVLSEILNKGGKIINSQKEVGGWPELKKGKTERDSDGDGVPDKWERRHGLNPKDGSDGAAVTPSGYTNLELWLHERAARQ